MPVMTEFRVVDQWDGEGTKQFLVKASTPEAAARQALGILLVRSGKSTVRAKVYFRRPGNPPTVVRLYVRAEDQDRVLAEASAELAASKRSLPLLRQPPTRRYGRISQAGQVKTKSKARLPDFIQYRRISCLMAICMVLCA
jgi:hypothetical protein